jgi:hypothetical protein
MNAAEVLAAFDRLLAEQPERVSHGFSDATRKLTAFRAEAIAGLREAPSASGEARLERLNAVLSILVGTHYPLGAPNWDQLQQARDLFARVA